MRIPELTTSNSGACQYAYAANGAYRRLRAEVSAGEGVAPASAGKVMEYYAVRRTSGALPEFLKSRTVP